MRDHDDRMAGLFFLAIIESGASQQKVEETVFSPLARERFEGSSQGETKSRSGDDLN